MHEQKSPIILYTLVESEAPKTSEADEFIQYFKSTWLDGHFPVRTWNYFNHGGPHTNNHVEGWHNHLKKMARKVHPNLFEFIEETMKKFTFYVLISQAVRTFN